MYVFELSDEEFVKCSNLEKIVGNLHTPNILSVKQHNYFSNGDDKLRLLMHTYGYEAYVGA